MSYIEFDKTQLINLNYSLSRELIRSNRAGTYGSCSITFCNTRKYHGLLVCPIDEFDGERHVLLSCLDETILQHQDDPKAEHKGEFHMGVHKYPGHNVFNPLGHKYLRDFTVEPIPTFRYRVGGVILKKEGILVSEEPRYLVRYTLVDAHSKTTIRLQPFLAFRSVHALTRANMDANTKVYPINNGVKAKLYVGYPYLHLQTSKKSEFVHAPAWHYNIEYLEEQERGYDFQEDLFVPGYFEFQLEKGESIIFSAGLDEAVTRSLSQKFENETTGRIPRDSFENCLKNAAQQFFLKKDKKTYIIAGYPWFGVWARDTFISLPGLTLSQNDTKTCKSVLDTMSNDLRDNNLFANSGIKPTDDVNSVDAPLWYFWAIQQYAYQTQDFKAIWKDYGKKMSSILEGFKNGTSYNIKMHNNGLIFAGEPGKALTWMDAIVFGKPVTPRIGYAVEINALWYNALCFALECAEKVKDTKFIEQWKDFPKQVSESFVQTFWDEKKNYLADYVNGDYKDFAVRPNQIFAASLPFSPIDDEKKKAVVDIVQQELLTPRGLRSLSPNHPDYKGVYYGDQPTRDAAYHQGTVWTWLLGHFCEAFLRLNKRSGIHLVKRLYQGFEEEMNKNGISTLSEIYDGNPPHEARGAISQAWSVSEVLRIKQLIDKFEQENL